MNPDRVRDFFACARERHAIYLRRAAGLSPPWTEDEIFQRYKFTNVFRELDRTTAWFREHVRDPLRHKPEVLLATVLFRMFNRVTTGEAIWSQPALGLGDELPGETAWDAFLRTGDIGPVRAAVGQYCHPGPYVTGAYIIKTPDGMDKLDGVLWIVEQFCTGQQPIPIFSDMEIQLEKVSPTWREIADELLREPYSLQTVHDWLCGFHFIGHFTAYEIVTDLRHTALLDQAPDINTWANAGPGASRGLNYLHDRPVDAKVGKEQQVQEMRALLELSRRPAFWPQAAKESIPEYGVYHVEGYERPKILPNSQWPAWELREVEMWLCEMAKRWRYQAGGAPPRGRFHVS